MKRSRIRAALVLVGILMSAGICHAADSKPASWRYNAHVRELPFPRSERAASIWAADWCWKDCGSYCAWGMAGCLQQDSQGQCLKLTDKCDRYCQRQCRTMGGPFLPFELPWE
jgi:hypothetical protein